MVYHVTVLQMLQYPVQMVTFVQQQLIWLEHMSAVVLWQQVLVQPTLYQLWAIQAMKLVKNFLTVTLWDCFSHWDIFFFSICYRFFKTFCWCRTFQWPCLLNNAVIYSWIVLYAFKVSIYETFIINYFRKLCCLLL